MPLGDVADVGEQNSEGSGLAPDLAVHGLDGLRVVDASVMPTITRANTQAPVIMIAERAAQMLRANGAVPGG